MKTVLPVLFLIIFFGCKNEGDQNINYNRGTVVEPYPLDSALFEFPCKNDSYKQIEYSGDVRYTVKDIDAAEKKIKEIITAYSLDLVTRNENLGNGVLHKSSQYTVPTEYFLLAEEKLDSLFGRADYKHISKNTLNYDHMKDDLSDEQNTYKMYINRYNNTGMTFQEKNELLTIIKDNGNNIKRTQRSIKASCENKSTLTIQFSVKLLTHN